MSATASKPTRPAFAALAGLFWCTVSMATLNIPDTPLFLASTGVAPNIVITLDDSGSMSWGYIPDALGADTDWRYVKSARGNPAYYNPRTIYSIPPNAAGAPVSNTTFTAAYKNGYAPSLGTLDLRSQYRPTKEWRIGAAAEQFMNHSVANLRCQQINNPPDPCQINTTAGTGNATWVNMENPVVDCADNVDNCKTRTGPAYYYVWDQQNQNCDGTTTDGDCYDIKIVSATSGPGTLDLDGNGVINANDRDERQNFANWYSYYRTRSLTTIASAASAFRDLPTTTRVAWQALDSCKGGATTLVTADCEGWEVTNPNFSNAIRPFDGQHRSNFYTWLFRLPANAWTPLRTAMVRAGEYYGTSGNGSPYDNDLLNDAVFTEYSCRKNYHIVMTDGVWNTDGEPTNWTPGLANFDTVSPSALPDGKTYTARNPYKDGNENSLADIAFKYWATDLRAGAGDNNADCVGSTCNKVPSYFTDFAGSSTDQYFNAKNDPANWQHMVNFTVGLGVTSFLGTAGLTWGGDTYAGSYSAILAGTKSWPATASNSAGNIADLWHAAINSRGQFYSAENPTALAAAFQDIVDTISVAAAAGGGAGLSSNTTQIDQAGALVFEAKFNADWSGKLLARPVQANGDLGTPYWDAGQLIPAPHARKIFTLNAQAEAFATCSGTLATALNLNASGNNDGLCAKRLNWLRGDGKIANATWANFVNGSSTVTATFTVTGHGFVTGDSVTISDVGVSENPTPAKSYNGTFVVTVVDANRFTASIPSAATGPGTYAGGGRARYTQFRNRQVSVLGDIMNSDPSYAFQDDFGYGSGANQLNGKNAYASFVTAKGTRPPVIYVGANDGMLHGFRADTGNQGSGVELLAYVPNGVYGNLSKLTDPAYQHKYYVDGPVSVGDAYIGGSWKTYLVGGLGAGGKTVYALDVSQPATFSQTDIKWEFSDVNDLGLTYSKPQIAPNTTTQWAVIFGNGYNSANDRAYLYVVDLSTGNTIAKVSTNSATGNGLSTPYLHDSDGDKIIDVAYAGDLQGNLWKFVNSAGVWTLGNGGNPLFTARNANNEVQPITSQPKVAAHPTGPGAGVLVYFGTGSYLITDDLTNDDRQSFYAIWDKTGTTGTVLRSSLQDYAILQQTTILGYTVRTTSSGTVNWATQRGWYLDLRSTQNTPAERVVSTPLIMEFTSNTVPDRVLFVTNTPSADPCSRGGTTWLMELDLGTGGHTATSVFNIKQDDRFDADDTVNGVPPSGIALQTSYGITGEPLLLKNQAGNLIKEFSGSTGESGTAGGPEQQGEPPNAAGSSAPTRIYWKQIL